MSLGYVCYLETLDAMLTIPVEIPEIKHMLNVLHRINVAVNVNIVVFGLDGGNEFSCIVHLHSPTLVDRTFLIAYNPVVDGAIVDGEDICWLAIE